jgi:hypothetical protein
MSVVDQIAAEAQRQGVDPNLAIEVATVESSLNQNAVSSAGAIGIFQLEPATAAQLGVNPYDPTQNIQGGIAYLRQMLAQFGDLATALAAYNCGPGCVQKLQANYGSNWLAYAPGETQSYVAKILGAVQTQYTPSFNPAAAFAPSSSVLNIPVDPNAAAAAAASSAPSMWGTLGIAVAVIFGISLVLSET